MNNLYKQAAISERRGEHGMAKEFREMAKQAMKEAVVSERVKRETANLVLVDSDR
jgi:hypothetical protein